MPIEQINNSSGAVLYLHHDQQGSTRLLTGSTGKTEATFTYGAYGELTGSTWTATTPLGYDGQYTNSDTGLIYMRTRSYDPATAQFLSVDPLDAITGERYSYAGDNPLNNGDPTGLDFLEEFAEGVAGWGDTLTFGATKWAREQIGDENVDTCSAGYQAGGFAGLATAALMPGEGEAEFGAEAADEGAGIEDVLGYVDSHGGEPPPGYVGGRTFENAEGGLPASDSDGNPITYREYDVHPGEPGPNRGVERIVVGSDGSAYFTNDHYTTFTRIR
jgi:RHS repeat-associated protein